MPVSSLADRLGYYVSVFTLYSSVRPFGITAILGGWDSEDPSAVDGEVGSGPSTGAPAADNATRGGAEKRGGPGLYMIEPSGSYWGYYGAATGKGRQAAKAELEKLDLSGRDGGVSLEEGVKEAARIILVAHEDNKDKEFEVEMTWVGRRTGGKHEAVPEGVRKEAEEWAKRQVEGEDDGEEGEGEGMQE